MSGSEPTSDLFGPCGRRPGSRLVLALAVVLWTACSSAPAPVVAPLREAAVRRPVVLVPGITGSMLRDRNSGRVVWGAGARLLAPRDGGYEVALPLGTGEDRLEATEVLERIRLAGLSKDVYGPIVRMLEANGYRRGDFQNPSRDASLFLFAYDWRRDNEETVALLARDLEALRRARGVDRLEVDLLCQSNGGHVCRYFAKYGGLSLDDAEAGRPRDSRIDVRKLILVGTSNGGSLRILRMLDRGRKYVFFGRKIQPETMFTFRALFQDLPAYSERIFLDKEGRVLDVDLYDPESWETYGWSVFGAETRRRLDRREREDLFGSADDRREYLSRVLEQARRLQDLLLRDADLGGARYYLVQNAYAETPSRGVLERRDGSWKTWLTGDRELARLPYVKSLATAPGDGHATVESQMWLAPREKEALARPPFYVRGDHFELILERSTLQALAEMLAE